MPSVVSPNGDGRGDVATIAYRSSGAASLTATLLREDGAAITTVFAGAVPAGKGAFSFSADGLADGRYRVALVALLAGGRLVTAEAPLVVSRVLDAFSATPASVSPNGDGRSDSVELAVSLLTAADVSLTITSGDVPVETLLSERLEPGTRTLSWDGFGAGAPLPDGRYAATLTVVTPESSVSTSIPLAVDTTPPHVRVVDSAPPLLSVDEPVTLAITGPRPRVVRVARASVVRLRGGDAGSTVVATDAAGNTSLLVLEP